MSLDLTEKIIGAINILGIIIFLISPYILYRFLIWKLKNFKFFNFLFLVLNFCLLALGIIVFVYWNAELVPQLLLNHFGFEYNDDSGASFEKVLPENRQRIEQIYASLFGIGWPLKAIFGCVFFALPYSFISSIIVYFINKKQK